MSDHALTEIFMVVSIVLAIALLFKAQESSHWKHSYETLRNEVLAESRMGTLETRRQLREIGGRYEDLLHEVGMTLDEFVDSQG